MRILSNRKTRYLIISILTLLAVSLLLVVVFWKYKIGIISLALVLLVIDSSIVFLLLIYFKRQDKLLEEAVLTIQKILQGEEEERLDCMQEGELSRLFHEINNFALIQSAHNDREKQTNEFLKQTIFDISHQLKTPLSALSIYLDLILQSEDISLCKEFTKSSIGEIERIESLIQNLLKLTKLDSGTIEFEKHNENLLEIIDDVVQRFSARSINEEKKINITGDDDIQIFCDKAWFSEAITNIVKNAFDHTQREGNISIDLEKSGNIVTITIADDGIGIHPEDINYIFKRFYRSRFSKDNTGVGLGLSLAKSIIEGHNGTISVDSKLNIGTKFKISIVNPTKL